jgi:hypothetical protein
MDFSSFRLTVSPRVIKKRPVALFKSDRPLILSGNTVVTFFPDLPHYLSLSDIIEPRVRDIYYGGFDGQIRRASRFSKNYR